MANLKNVIAYLLTYYPYKHDLSKARLTKMIYLADWKSALDHGRQMTDIAWRFNHFGPYVDDVHRVALENSAFEVVTEKNAYGNRKERIVLKAKNSLDLRVSDEEAKILDHVIEQTKPLQWDPFIKLVYSTYPVLTGTRGESLDLLHAAETYRAVETQLADAR